MEWISVKDEMPNYDFEVIVVDKHGMVSTGWYRFKKESLDCFDNWDGLSFKDITHWMPLPEPPKQ